MPGCGVEKPVKMIFGLSFVVLLSLTVVGQALTPSTYFTPADRDRFRHIFLTSAADDLESLYYSVIGTSLLGDAPPEPQKTCEKVKKLVDTSDVTSLFYATSIANVLKASKTNCEVSLGKAEELLQTSATDASSSLKMFHSVATLKNLNRNVDSAKVSEALVSAIKDDDSPMSYACAFYAASFLTGKGVEKVHSRIDEAVAQADEVDETYLQFDSGLYTTALLVDSAYEFAAASMSAAPIPEDKVMKFANYFLSRKHTHLLKDVFALLQVLNTLVSSKFHTPVAVTLASAPSVSAKNPNVQVRVSDLVGKSLGKLSVTAETARHLGDDAVVLSKQPFTVSSADPSLYELDLMKVTPESGFYRITVSVAASQPSGVKLIGTAGAEVEVKVIIPIAIDGVEVSIVDREHMSAQKSTKLQMPNKAQLEADYHQRLTTRFSLKDATSGKAVTAHQTFVRLLNVKTKQEVIYVAEEDSAGTYRFDLDIGAKSKDFNNLSGKYTMELIVGDAVIENPITWLMADVELTFSEDAVPVTSDEYRYSKKPEIKHLFREPEKRPSAVVSNVFTVLTVAPILILVIMWIKIGVNVSNFSFSISTIGFHVGMTAIFVLYVCYFFELNMFETLRYLGLIGLPTFLCGNKLLSSIAARRKG